MAKIEELVAAANKSAKLTIGGMGLQAEDPVRLPTGIFPLDLGLGGGFPIGRCSIIFGHEAAMKTTLLLKLIANHQRLYPEKRCVFFDVEHHLLQSWAEIFGVDWSKLYIIRPLNSEHII